MNQTVKTYLHHYVNEKQDNWVQLLSTAQYAYNNVQNKTTEVTLFYVNYEYHLKIWQQLQTHKMWSQKVMINIVKQKKLHKDLTQRKQTQQGTMTKVKPFEIEEKVYLWTNNIKIKQKSKKLNHKSIELFMIKRNVKDLSYELNLSTKIRIYSTFYAFMLQCCDQTILTQITETSVELNNKYKVKAILKKRTISEAPHYLIKWKKYDISENIWKLKKNLKNCVRTLQHFQKRARE